MKTGNLSDFGSWKCGKDRAFTHIPTNFIILFKRLFIIILYLTKENRGEKV